MIADRQALIAKWRQASQLTYDRAEAPGDYKARLTLAHCADELEACPSEPAAAEVKRIGCDHSACEFCYGLDRRAEKAETEWVKLQEAHDTVLRRLAAMTGLVEQWRKSAARSDETFKKDSALGRSMGLDVAASVTRKRADDLAALLPPPPTAPEMKATE